MAGSELPFVTRLWFAWVCFFRVLFDGAYAAQLHSGKALGAPEKAPELPARVEPPKAELVKPEEPTPAKVEAAPKPEPKRVPVTPAAPPTDAALQLLALLQREGRFVDFLEEDVTGFADADIGAAARVVHQGCRKALRDHIKLEAIRSEEEGARLTLAEGFDARQVKLTGNVQGQAPYTGTLRHRGWRASEVSLPTAVGDHDARIVAQAEVEL